MPTNPNNTQSIQRAFLILSCFSHETPMLRVNDIAKQLELTPSTVSRHLSTMLDMNFVERDSETGAYRLGTEIITLAGVSLHSHAIYRHSYPILQELSLKTNLHCSLGIPQGGDIIHLISVGPEDTLDLFSPIGYHHSLPCCAIGRVILANYPPQEVQRLLFEKPIQPYTPLTVTNPSELLKVIETVHTLGYAKMINELTLGKSSIAAPVFGTHRAILGGISLSGTTSNLDLAKRENELSQIVIETARRISAKMGYFQR